MMTLAFEVSLHSLSVESYLLPHHHNEFWAGLTTRLPGSDTMLALSSVEQSHLAPPLPPILSLPTPSPAKHQLKKHCFPFPRWASRP